MKKHLLVALVGVAFTVSALADIQDPPSNDYGPTRKLGRGLGNFLFGGAEIPVTICKVSKEEGNSAAASYGVVRGVGRAFARHGTGLVEMLLWPAPTWRNGYYPMLRSDVPWIHGGYSEFPPELGFESKYPYCRDY
jgi:putative exosortase-associated protein (TIGR04073 family)